jgi:hypothetical protein
MTALGKFYLRLDAVAHFLYCPTMLGRRCARARWHHNIHLIPGWLLAKACNRCDDFWDDEPVEKLLAAFDALPKGKTVVPVGFRCQHVTMTTGGGIFKGRPTVWCGCKMTPIFADDLTTT